MKNRRRIHWEDGLALAALWLGVVGFVGFVACALVNVFNSAPSLASLF